MIIENTNGARTFFVEAGPIDGEALMLLHGLGADHEMWTPQIETLAERGYRVLVPDLLGHGQSSRVQTFTLADWERQIIHLLDFRGLQRCTPVGVSMGGVIAQSFAMHHPDRLRRLILCDTFGELRTWKEKLLGVSQIAGLHLFKLLGPNMLARSMAATYKAPFARAARDYFVTKSQHADIAQMILARKAINRIDAIGKIDGQRIPTLVMVGDQFGEFFIRANRKIADAIASARFVILLNAMDPSNLVNPAAFNREVLDFLSQE